MGQSAKWGKKMNDWKGMVYKDGFAYAEINGKIYKKKLERVRGERMSYYYHLEENEIQKIQTGSKNKWYI